MTGIKRYLPIIILILLSLSAWYFGISKHFNLETLRENHKTLELYISKNFIASLLIFAGIYTTSVSLSIPGATFLTIVGGFLFGPFIATFVVVISATIGATILFITAKSASQRLLTEKIGSWLKKLEAGFRDNALFFLLTVRLIPIFPFVIINLAAALLQIPLSTFFIGTLIGIIPGSFVYVSMGYALKDVIQAPNLSPSFILEPSILLALVGLGILAFLPVLYKLYRHRKALD